MNIIELGRHQGKTQFMVDWLKEYKSGVLLVFSELEKQRILDQYFPESREEMAPRIITSIQDLRGRAGKRVGIDNLDIILQGMVGAHDIGPVTVTEEE